MEIKLVQLKSGFIPFTLRKASETETVVEFWLPTYEMQKLHNGRFHCNLMTSDWYVIIPKNLGLSFKFHQAGYDPENKFDYSIADVFQHGKIKDVRKDVYVACNDGYNRVELFGENITQETVERYLVTYLTE